MLYHKLCHFFLDAEDNDKEGIKYSEFSRQFVMIVSSNISNFLGIIPYFIRKQLLKKVILVVIKLKL